MKKSEKAEHKEADEAEEQSDAPNPRIAELEGLINDAGIVIGNLTTERDRLEAENAKLRADNTQLRAVAEAMRTDMDTLTEAATKVRDTTDTVRVDLGTALGALKNVINVFLSIDPALYGRVKALIAKYDPS